MVLQTIEEWEAYIQQLAGQTLRSKGINANTIMFTQSMAKQGFTTDDVSQILLFFVRQFIATGQQIPTGGLYDLRGMALADPVCRMSQVMSEEDADALAANPPPEPEDEDDLDVIEPT